MNNKDKKKGNEYKKNKENHKRKRKKRKEKLQSIKHTTKQFEKLGEQKEYDFLVLDIAKTIKHHFADFYKKLSECNDPRHAKHYKIEEIIFGGISLFLFKMGSRNNYNNYRKTGNFQKNFERIYKLCLPSLDAVASVLKELPECELEKFKTHIIKTLLKKRIFHKWRFFKKFLVAIDGTGLCSFKEEPYPEATKMESKNGKETFFYKVLEAKIVTSNGSIRSICTVFIDNEDTNSGLYDKQGCEKKAFVKLAKKLKKEYPRLPICLCADGLYPNNPFFEICKNNGWDYIVTLKDGNLKRLWNNIRLVEREYRENNYQKASKKYTQIYQWIPKIEHNGFIHNWVQCNETVTKTKKDKKTKKYKQDKFRFVYLTNIDIDYENIIDIVNAGRLRWKIENQGFDQQKNHGYNIQHKYFHKNYLGMKNFYQCCQIAHTINQLVELSKDFEKLKIAKMTTEFLWVLIRAFMLIGKVATNEIEYIYEHKFQIQYVQ